MPLKIPADRLIYFKATISRQQRLSRAIDYRLTAKYVSPTTIAKTKSAASDVDAALQNWLFYFYN